MNIINLQKIAENLKNYICKKYQLKDIKIKVKKINRGRAICKSRFISIPAWAYYEANIYHYIYYILHELSHFINYDNHNGIGHDIKFKEIEKNLLFEFKIKPKYKKAYIKELWNLKNELLYIGKSINLYNIANNIKEEI